VSDNLHEFLLQESAYANAAIRQMLEPIDLASVELRTHFLAGSPSALGRLGRY